MRFEYHDFDFIKNNIYIYTSILFRNYTIQYLPIPITDIIQMKITEKDRMEKVQTLITKVIEYSINFQLNSCSLA
jgi:hypothetical protein